MKNISKSILFCLLLSFSTPIFPQGLGQTRMDNSSGFIEKKPIPSLIGQYRAKVEEQGELFTVVWQFRRDSSFIFEAKARNAPKSSNKSMRGKWSLRERDMLVHNALALVNESWREIPADSFSVSNYSDTSITLDMHGKSIIFNKQVGQK